MMLIPQAHTFGPTENITQSIVKANYFPSSIDKPDIVATANISAHNSSPVPFRSSQQHIAPEHQHMFAPRMQSDVSGFNMYAGAAGPAGPGAIPSPAGYGAPTNPPHGFVPPHYGSTGIDHSPYYPALGPTGYDGKAGGNGDVWAGAGYGQAAPPYYQYDNFGSQYPYDSRYCGMDVNDGVRRKNATRESTNTLKAWLQEHKKNPYPTKGEKIMLAIITKMTLTQVSTWFANARRRLKKENKMTWVPKNRTNDSSNSSDDRRESDDKDADERLDDDCRSDTEVDERNIKSAKSDVSDGSENKSSCQFPPEEKPVYEQDAMMDNQHAPSDSPDAGFPDPNARLDNPNIVGRLHDGQPCSQFDRREMNPHHRSIWSPVDNHKQTRTYSEYPDHSRALYPEADAAHSHGLHPSHGMHPEEAGSLQHNFPPMLQHSQEQRYTPTNVRYSTANVSGSPGSATSHSIEADDRRNECRFTSPVTNLQNWVNGVFHGPPSSSEEKSHLQNSKSPTNEEATDLSTGRSNFNHSQQYMKHQPLGESKSVQYGGQTTHPFSSQDYYDQHRLLTKTQSATLDHTNSPYYQAGIDGTSSPGIQNSIGAPQPGSTPKSCSLSPPHQQLPTSSALPFYENPMVGNEQRPGLPPPYIGQYQRDTFHSQHTNINLSSYRHNFMSENPGQSITPSSAPNQIMSPPTLTGSNSNESSTVEYKATAQT